MKMRKCADGRLRVFCMEVLDYPKVVAYANEHNCNIEIKAHNTAHTWMKTLDIVLVPRDGYDFVGEVEV